MRIQLFLLVILSLSLVVAGEELAPSDQDIINGKKPLPGLTLELSAPARTFPLGEAIPIILRYTYTGVRKLSFWRVTYNRSGRISEFGFFAVDAEGKPVRDPIKNHLGGMGGGMRSNGKLKPGEPYSQEVPLNEWLCFDKPGRYKVSAVSRIVGFDDKDTGWSSAFIPLKSDPLEIEITAPDKELRKRHLADAERTLAGGKDDEREAAVETLRFMVDERAIPLLTKALNDKSGNVQIAAHFGLLSFSDMSQVKEAVLKLMEDPNYPLDPTENLWSYTDLLATAELRAEKRESESRFDDAHKKWRTALTAKFIENLEKLPLEKNVNATVKALAFGPIVSQYDPKNWKHILDHAGLIDQEHLGSAEIIIASNCRNKVLIPELKNAASNEKLPPVLRSAAIVALHALGDTSSREMIYADVISESPLFSNEAHATLGDYRADELSRELVALLEKGPPNRSLAERVRDLGVKIPADKLCAAAAKEPSDVSWTTDILLEALALNAPEEAVPALTAGIEKRRNSDVNQPIALLCRIDSAKAREAVSRLFESEREEVRQAVAYSLDESYRTAKQYNDRYLNDGGRPGRALLGLAATAERFALELLKLYKNDKSGKVRQAARNALSQITGIPKEGSWNLTDEQEAKLVPQWEEWGKRHTAGGQ